MAKRQTALTAERRAVKLPKRRPPKQRKKNSFFGKNLRENRSFYLMLLPGVIFMLLFVYYPFVSGIRLAFVDTNLIAGTTEFVGLQHFQKLFQDQDFITALGNTVVFGVFNVALGVVLPAAMALLLNEVRLNGVKRVFQTIIYLPSLFSWVIIGAMFLVLFSPTTGPVNIIIEKLGGESIYFFAEPKIAKLLFIALAQWKGVGFGLIVYLAAITSIDSSLYEAAEIDGAGRWGKMLHITLPGIKNTTKMMLMFAIIGILSLFDQVLVMSNGVIGDKVNVVMTYIYTTGIRRLQLGYASAAALVVGAITLTITLVSKKILRFGFEGGGEGE